MANLLRKVMKISPQLVAAFVHGVLSTALSNLRTLPVQDVEVSINLLYQLGDGLTALDGNILSKLYIILDIHSFIH